MIIMHVTLSQNGANNNVTATDKQVAQSCSVIVKKDALNSSVFICRPNAMYDSDVLTDAGRSIDVDPERSRRCDSSDGVFQPGMVV